MDPLSITIGVAQAVGNSVKALQKYAELRARYDSTDLSILSAKTQCDCILTSLNKIQDTLLSRPRLAERWTSDHHLPGRNLQSTMSACELTFSVLSQKLHELLDQSVDRHGLATTKVKLINLWRNSEISIALTHISALVPALNLLLTALSADSQAEMMDILASKRTRTIFSKVSSNAESIRTIRYNPSNAAVSEVSRDGSGDQDFSFDAFVINSEIYKKAWVTAKKQRPLTKAKPVVRHEHRHLAKVMAAFDADPQSQDQISVSRFETVEVSQLEEDWWQVRKDTGDSGRVPRQYLCLFDARLTLHNGARALRAAHAQHWVHATDAPLVVKAVFAYQADPKVPDELSFTKDEILEVTEKVPGWWNAKKDDGEVGIVPSPYFILADPARPTVRPPSPPPSYKRLTEEPVADAVEERPDPFDLLDSPHIAQAVWNASQRDIYIQSESSCDDEDRDQTDVILNRQKK